MLLIHFPLTEYLSSARNAKFEQKTNLDKLYAIGLGFTLVQNMCPSNFAILPKSKNSKIQELSENLKKLLFH